MKRYLSKIFLFVSVLFLPTVTFAASNPEVAGFAHDTLNSLLILASLGVVIFLIRGGYQYITSTGDPAALDEAKRTIRNALIGLILVISAAFFSSFLGSALSNPSATGSSTAIALTPIQPATPDGSLTQIILDAISGFLKNIITSATAPLFNGITWFLTSTPTLATNSVVFNFWLVMVGITDSLFAVVIAILGLQMMSASSFGFEELTLKELLPKIGLTFLLANTSIFWIDWIISLCQTLVHAVLNATGGGLAQAWISNAFDPAALLSGSTNLITLIFVVAFIILAAVLLLFYISRLMILAFGAVISPLVCLLSLLPRAADFTGNLVKTYLITIFTVFVHVVIIQLASSFLSVPGQSGTNPIVSVLIGIAMFAILLKSTAMATQLVLASSTTGAVKKLGSGLLNVMSPAKSTSTHSNSTTKPVRSR